MDPASGNDPYCSQCGYSLKGLVDSSKCPECGRPLVEVLARRQMMPLGKRYRSKIHIFGWPLVSVAFGAGPEGIRGIAKGIIAIGDIAIGGLAFGGMAVGVIAFGGMALGLTALGGLGVGILAAMGGGAIGGLACGGGALGLVAQGGGAVGVIADGGGAFGSIVRSGANFGRVDPRFAEWHWLLGAAPGQMQLGYWIMAVMAGVAAVSILILLAGWLVTGRKIENENESCSAGR